MVDYFSALIFVGFLTKEKRGLFDFSCTFFVNGLFDGLFIFLLATSPDGHLGGVIKSF